MSFLQTILRNLRFSFEGSFFNLTSSKAFTIQVPVFGKQEWDNYLGTVKTAPPIPQHLLNALDEPCKFWPDKKGKDTLILFLVPQSVNDQPLDLIALLQLSQTALPESHQTTHIDRFGNLATEPTKEARWALMTKEPIPGSSGLSFDEQKDLVAKFDYQVPTLKEAMIGILAARLTANLALFADSSSYTRCKETLENWPICLGITQRGDFNFYLNDWNYYNGVAAIRY